MLRPSHDGPKPWQRGKLVALIRLAHNNAEGREFRWILTETWEFAMFNWVCQNLCMKQVAVRHPWSEDCATAKMRTVSLQSKLRPCTWMGEACTLRLPISIHFNSIHLILFVGHQSPPTALTNNPNIPSPQPCALPAIGQPQKSHSSESKVPALNLSAMAAVPWWCPCKVLPDDAILSFRCFSGTMRWLAMKKNGTPVTQHHMLCRYAYLRASHGKEVKVLRVLHHPGRFSGKAKRRSKPVQILPAQPPGDSAASLGQIHPANQRTGPAIIAHAFNKRFQSGCMMPTHDNSDELCFQLCLMSRKLVCNFRTNFPQYRRQLF